VSETMYDSVNVNADPATAKLIACYDDGTYANVTAALKRFPTARILTIDVTGRGKAQALDIENGDATFAELDGWLAQYAVKEVVFSLPVAYASLDPWKTNFPASHPKGCLAWTAHYTGVPHVCGLPCGLAWQADMTQYTTGNGTYDTSLVNAPLYTAPAPPPPPLPSKPVSGVQSGWSWCSKCQGLFYGPNVARTSCPAGGPHIRGTWDYSISFVHD
jgi:hypothetical protein